jgi:hypothetical protein
MARAHRRRTECPKEPKAAVRFRRCRKASWASPVRRRRCVISIVPPIKRYCDVLVVGKIYEPMQVKERGHNLSTAIRSDYHGAFPARRGGGGYD